MLQKGRTPPPLPSPLRTVTFEYEEAVYQVTYDARRGTREFRDALDKRAAAGDRIGPTLTYWSTLITSWDLKDDAGQPLPITEEAVLSLAQTKLPAIMKAVNDDADMFLDQRRREGR